MFGQTSRKHKLVEDPPQDTEIAYSPEHEAWILRYTDGTGDIGYFYQEPHERLWVFVPFKLDWIQGYGLETIGRIAEKLRELAECGQKP